LHSMTKLSRKFWWRRFNLPCRKRRMQTSDVAE
jgi:hypothetical protein